MKARDKKLPEVMSDSKVGEGNKKNQMDETWRGNKTAQNQTEKWTENKPQSTTKRNRNVQRQKNRQKNKGSLKKTNKKKKQLKAKKSNKIICSVLLGLNVSFEADLHFYM